MDLLTTLIIALSLSADAFAVSLSSGLILRHFQFNKALKIALFFGSFQAIMPVIGWGFGLRLRNLISGIDHWIAFGLLSAIGIKMIDEALQSEEKEKFNPTDTYTLFILAIATSIDALAVGIGFAVLEVGILKSVIIIGTITFIVSLIGVFTDHKFGDLLGEKVEILGGLTLIVIGCKILIEHLNYP